MIKDDRRIEGMLPTKGSLINKNHAAGRTGSAKARLLVEGAIVHARGEAPEHRCPS